MEDPTRGTPALPPRVGHVLRLAEIIREVEVHGSTITVDALALAILAHPGFSGCHDGPAALPAQGELGELAEFTDAIAADAVPSSTAARIRRVAEVLRAFSLGGWLVPAEEQAATPPPLLPDYIDAEHQGEDRELLEAFQRAWWAESGSSDKCHMAGIRAVLALRPTVAAVRAADAAIADEALEADFRAWWRANVHPLNVPAYHTITTHLAWGRHLLSRGGL